MAENWQDLLTELAARYEVPGAVLLVADDDDVQVAATGITNVTTGVPVTERTLFQIGSISKVWTATLAMSLVDEGLLDLDEPVVTYLPEFGEGPDRRTSLITMRHLLTHTSGLECDLFADTGRGDDSLRKHLPMLANSTLMYAPGDLWSYCNSGFILAGLVLEQLTDTVWETLIEERISKPLGLPSVATLPEQALLHSAAMGHVHEHGEPFKRADAWHFPRVVGPAGSIATTAAELLAFARAHLDLGAGPQGRRVLSEASAAAMQREVVPLAGDSTREGPESWGIGWGRKHWGDELVLWHNGGTIGQSAYLDVLPSRRGVFMLLTNGGLASDLADDLRRRIVPEVFGLEYPGCFEPDADAASAVSTGRFVRYGATAEIDDADGAPRMALIEGPEHTGVDESRTTVDLVPGPQGSLLFTVPGSHLWAPVWPVEVPGGGDGVMVGRRLMLRAT